MMLSTTAVADVCTQGALAVDNHTSMLSVLSLLPNVQLRGMSYVVHFSNFLAMTPVHAAVEPKFAARYVKCTKFSSKYAI
jgi:hypothetical protein